MIEKRYLRLTLINRFCTGPAEAVPDTKPFESSDSGERDSRVAYSRTQVSKARHTHGRGEALGHPSVLRRYLWVVECVL